MATKTISITEDAYERLAVLKNENESFSEIIGRITKKPKLSEFFGILSEEKGKELEKNVRGLRASHKKSREKRIKRIREALS
tara:strand:+ start:513 stop:758 length:246 start_codon:yes stop_codon:yes gene_type:complete